MTLQDLWNERARLGVSGDLHPFVVGDEDAMMEGLSWLGAAQNAVSQRLRLLDRSCLDSEMSCRGMSQVGSQTSLSADEEELITQFRAFSVRIKERAAAL